MSAVPSCLTTGARRTWPNAQIVMAAVEAGELKAGPPRQRGRAGAGGGLPAHDLSRTHVGPFLVVGYLCSGGVTPWWLVACRYRPCGKRAAVRGNALREVAAGKRTIFCAFCERHA